MRHFQSHRLFLREKDKNSRHIFKTPRQHFNAFQNDVFKGLLEILLLGPRGLTVSAWTGVHGTVPLGPWGSVRPQP